MKKRWICRLLVCCLAFCLAVPVFAVERLDADNAEQDQNGTVIEGTGDTYTVAYEAGSTESDAGKQFVLLVLKKGVEPANMDVDSILYIDQAESVWDAASSKAVVRFEGFKLKRRMDADVWIGGGESPVNPWFIKVAGIDASGAITLVAGDTGAATIKLLNTADGTEVADAQSDTAGAYTFNAVQGGVYDVRIEKAGYLPVTLKNVDLTETETIETVDMAQYGGDFNGDGIVDFRDLNMLIQEYNRENDDIEEKAVNINNDAIVDFRDLNVLISGYNEGNAEKDSQNRPIGVVIGGK